jgi:hypothetical protein
MEPVRFLNLEYLFLLIYNLFAGERAQTIPLDLSEFWASFKIFSTFVSLFFVTGLVYCIVRIYQIRKAEKAELGLLAVPVTTEEQKNTRWQGILDHLGSDNPNDWRQAIMEADILLDEMVTIMGYRGENLGEKMKTIERSDFKTLDEAWEAHKVRNAIAHEGSNFMLTQREARRVIDLYKQVFQEFEYV